MDDSGPYNSHIKFHGVSIYQNFIVGGNSNYLPLHNCLCSNTTYYFAFWLLLKYYSYVLSLVDGSPKEETGQVGKEGPLAVSRYLEHFTSAPFVFFIFQSKSWYKIWYWNSKQNSLIKKKNDTCWRPMCAYRWSTLGAEPAMAECTSSESIYEKMS